MNNNKILILAIFVFSLGLKAPNEPEAQELQGSVPQAENVEASTPALDEIGCEVGPEESNKILKGCIGMAGAALAGLLLWKPIKNGLKCREMYYGYRDGHAKEFCLKDINNDSVIFSGKQNIQAPYIYSDSREKKFRFENGRIYYNEDSFYTLCLNLNSSLGENPKPSSYEDLLYTCIDKIKNKCNEKFESLRSREINKKQFYAKIGDENFNAKLASELVARCLLVENKTLKDRMTLSPLDDLLAEYVQLKVKQHENELWKGYRSFWLSNLYSKESSINYESFCVSVHFPKYK